MTITINGDRREIPAGTSVLELLSLLELDPARVAVELNRSIIRKPEWAGRELQEGDSLEVVTFVGGG